MYTIQLIDDVKDFIKNRLEAALVVYETALTVTVTRLTDFVYVVPANLQYPIGMVYDVGDQFEPGTLAEDQEVWKLAVEVGDMRIDLSQLRTNLYAYRDVILGILQADASLGGIVTQAYVTAYEPPLALQNDSNNYMGAIKLYLTIEI